MDTALVLLSSVCFGAMGMMVKALGPAIPVFELAFVRGAVTLPLLSLLMAAGGETIAAGRRWRMLTVCALPGLGAMVCYFHALAHLPIADAVTLNYTAPLFATLIGALLLGERLRPRTIACLGVALVGVYLVLRPGFGGEPGYSLVALGAGLLSGVTYVTVKRLATRESPWTIVWYFNAVAALGSLLLASSGWRWPTTRESLWLVGIALAGATGQVLMTLGFRTAPLGRAVVPTAFVVVVTSAGGWILWGERPSAATVAGVAAILAAVAGLVPRRSRRRTGPDRLAAC